MWHNLNLTFSQRTDTESDFAFLFQRQMTLVHESLTKEA